MCQYGEHSPDFPGYPDDHAEGYEEQVTETQYTKPSHIAFCRDMEAAGLEVEDYQGRWYYHGPAVRTEDLQEVLSATSVKCQWDEMGKHGYIVYPK